MDSLIFDVDGTLWDSTFIVAKAWNDYLLAEDGKDYHITDVTLKGLFGRLLIDIAKVLFPDKPYAEQERLIDECCQKEHEALIATPAPLYPGMEETLRALSEKIPLFIVSNCQAGYIEVFLEGTGTEKYFTDHLCPGDSGKAKADNILLIKEKHHLSSPFYVGDTQGDFTACKEAGVPFIHVNYGFASVPDAPYQAQTPAELLTLCQKLIEEA
ncbi:MAG: HAD family hydrolase [Blautia sp.]|nr:HAD family hydrolase [Blautia sp.]